jgi:putative peptidoglycan lipid II flippase
MVSLTLISKIFGFIREMIIANFYGTNYIVDAYVMATAIPSILLGGLFVAIATAFTPNFSTIREDSGEVESNKFTSQVINLLIMLSMAAIVIGIVFSRDITAIFARGFYGETAELTSYFIRITFSYVLFSSVAGILDAYMQYKGSFLKPIISGYFQNAGVIIMVIVSAYTSHHYMAFGLLIGSLFRVLYIWIGAKEAGYKYSPNFCLGEPIRKIVGMAIPVFIGSYILQINSFVDKTLASGLPEGSVAALNYGMILITLITGLTVTLLVTLIYPKITKAFTLDSLDEFNNIVEKGTSIIAIITIPFSMGILAFSDEVVQIVYERGAFDPSATNLTSGAFFFYGIGLVFFAFNDLLAKVFYSMRNTKAPIVCSGISVIINITLNLLLIESMAHKGLALATSIAAMANSLLLYLWMNKKYPKVKVIGSGIKILKIILASFIAVLAAWFVNDILINLVWMPRMVYLFIAVSCAAGIYLLILKLLEVEDIKIIRLLFKKK